MLLLPLLLSTYTHPGIKRPTQVQVGCIPAILGGRNVIGTAQTGSGKTAAFALPILQHLAKDPFGVFCLVLTPTRCAGNGVAVCWEGGACREEAGGKGAGAQGRQQQHAGQQLV